MSAFYNEFRRSVYQEADIDTIKMAHELAAQSPLNTYFFHGRTISSVQNLDAALDQFN